MEIIYLIISLVLFINFYILKKSDKKQSAIGWFALTSVLFMCYNIFIVYILSLVYIRSTLLVLSIVNLVFNIVLGIINYKKKEFQSYGFTKKDAFFSIAIFSLVIVVMFLNYTPNLYIKYGTVDIASHYTAAREFSKQSILLNKVERTTLFKFETHMPATYVNIGILFGVFDGFIGETNLHFVFMLFDMVMYLLMGLVFYDAISNKIKGKINGVIALIFIVLFMIGYPLNSIQFGFSYLTFNLLIAITLIRSMKFFETDELKDTVFILVAFLLNFAVFFSYYLFMPVIYASVFIYFVICMKKKGKLFSIKNFVIMAITLALPTIFGFIYFILPGMLVPASSDFNALTAEGSMYRDLYSNFLFFIPFMAFYIVNKIKSKEFKFDVILTGFLLAFMAIMFAGGMMGKVSSYYYYKNYYLLWIVSLYISFRAYAIMSEETNARWFARCCIVGYCILISASIGLVERRIENEVELFATGEKASQITNIYYDTIREMFGSENIVFDSNKYELVKKVYEINPVHNIHIDGQFMEKYLIYAITNIYEIEQDPNTDYFYDDDSYTVEEWLNTGKEYYLVFFYPTNPIQIDEDSKTYEIVEINDGGALLRNANI